MNEVFWQHILTSRFKTKTASKSGLNNRNYQPFYGVQNIQKFIEL